jgi:hypothetical protein
MTFSHPDVQIKGYKIHRGHEGEPLAQGSLYFRGKKLCLWSDGDWGGPFSVDPALTDPKASVKSLMADFTALARSKLQGSKDYLDRPYNVAEMTENQIVSEYIERVVGEYSDTVELAKATKDGAILVYRLKDGEMYATDRAYTAENVAHIKATTPNLQAIINEVLGQAPLTGEAAQAAADVALKASYKSKCRTKTIFAVRTPGAADMDIKVVNQPHSEKLAAQIRAKYGADLLRIVNEI